MSGQGEPGTASASGVGEGDAPGAGSLPSTGFELDLAHAGLVVIDPQNSFLSPNGEGWPLFGRSITENNTVRNLRLLFEGSKEAGIIVAISPHYYYPTDHRWNFGGPIEHLMHSLRMFDRAGSLSMEGFDGSGADFLDEYKPYILDGETIIASPHKIWGPQTNDLTLQLRKRRVSQIILAGMSANLCVESHLRQFLEEGFEVAVAKDATASPRIPEGDGYLAAVTNFEFLAHAVWTTEEALGRLMRVRREATS
jgi:nicotinamidase-related amidase